MNTTTNFASAAQANGLAHLSEEQIDEQLMGDLTGEAAEHLAACGECTLRVSEAAVPMENFRAVAMAWSERQSATMPIPVVQSSGMVWQRRAGWAMTACALVVGISITANARRTEWLQPSTQSAQSVDTASVSVVRVVGAPADADHAGIAVSAEQYSGDNRMLKAIDTELDASVETPAALGLEPVSDTSRGQSGPISVQD